MNFRNPHFCSLHFAIFLMVFMTSALYAQDATPSTGTLSDQSGTSDFSVGKVRDALASQQTLIAAHPQDPANYVGLAYALIDAGMGDLAREQVLKATMVAPQSSFAYNAQGWVLHHNSIGVDYGKPYDYKASVAAYRKAIELAPNDLDARQSLANTLEFNEEGIRYAPDSHLADAIEIYRYVKAHQRIVEPEVEDNLLIDLFYSGQFKEVVDETAALSPTPVRDGVAIAAIAASQGTTMAIARANQISGDPQRRSAALDFAAEGLWNMRLYPQAADLLAAGLQEQGDSSSTLGKIQTFRSLKPFQCDNLPATDPRIPVQRLVSSAITGNLTEAIASATISRHAFADEDEWQSFLKKSREAVGMLRALSIKTGLPLVVMQDIVLGTMKIIAEPDDGSGYRIVVQTLGSTPKRFFVVKEAGVFKLVAGDSDSTAIGNEALYLLHHGEEAEARSLLDWRRESVEKGHGDDPLSGVLFAQFWNSGQSKEADAIETAAASLLTESSSSVALLPRLIAIRDKASTDQARTNLELLLAHIYLHAEDGPNAKLLTQKLLDQYPDSTTAVRLAGLADRLVKDWPAWNSMLASRLAQKPNDRNLLAQQAEEAESEGDFIRARKSLRLLLDSGRALADDYNTYAWLSLFSGNS
jgi:tetratricopeptide (TPR) repeat protein